MKAKKRRKKNEARFCAPLLFLAGSTLFPKKNKNSRLFVLAPYVCIRARSSVLCLSRRSPLVVIARCLICSDFVSRPIGNVVEHISTHANTPKSVNYHLAFCLFLSCVADSRRCQRIASTLALIAMSISFSDCYNLLSSSSFLRLLLLVLFA